MRRGPSSRSTVPGTRLTLVDGSSNGSRRLEGLQSSTLVRYPAPILRLQDGRPLYPDEGYRCGRHLILHLRVHGEGSVGYYLEATESASEPSFKPMLLQDTKGYGKSHLLHPIGIRAMQSQGLVVFIADAEIYIHSMVPVLKKALTPTFINDTKGLSQLTGVVERSELVKFLNEHAVKGSMLFIIDKFNALEDSEGGKEAQPFLTSLIYGHRVIFASSANHTAMKASTRFGKDNVINRRSLTDGFSEVRFPFFLFLVCVFLSWVLINFSRRCIDGDGEVVG